MEIGYVSICVLSLER